MVGYNNLGHFNSFCQWKNDNTILVKETDLHDGEIFSYNSPTKRFYSKNACYNANYDPVHYLAPPERCCWVDQLITHNTSYSVNLTCFTQNITSLIICSQMSVSPDSVVELSVIKN